METRRLKTRGRATLSEIAKDAGVAVSTASLVLSGKAKQQRISHDVITRVQAAAVKRDYSPNLLVQSLQCGRTQILSFFNGFRNRNLDDLYMDRLTTALERSAGRLGYDILVYCDFSRSEQETYRNINGGRSDGLFFFAPQSSDPLLPYLRESRLPIVLINRSDTEGVLSSVQPDLTMGIRQIAEQLVALGHRRIAAITHIPGGNPAGPERVALLQTFLGAHGVTIPSEWVLPALDQRPTDAEAALRFLMNEPNPPTALFCWHDRVGYQILEQCAAQGISVPERLSVVGFDGLHWPAATPHTLASASLGLDVMADAAIRLLDRLIREQEETAVQQILPVTLAMGTTLAEPPQGTP